jgi:hypothetical protein
VQLAVQDQLNGKMYLPLQQAMERKIVIVHETSNVNELAIENVSRTEEVFVQAGDIVKGGQQDRVLAVDMIMPARSGKMQIDAFCVEHDRWHRRGAEPSEQFSASSKMVASKDLKLATKQEASQARVWREVGVAQEKLSARVAGDAQSEDSPSSLQLTMENTAVSRLADEYVRNLLAIVEEKSDVVGFAFAINGKINSADLYGSNSLFLKLWPKLLNTAAIEAVSERQTNETITPVSAEMINAFLVDAESGQESPRDVTERTQMIKRQSVKSLFFETRDSELNAVWIHRNYLAN